MISKSCKWINIISDNCLLSKYYKPPESILWTDQRIRNDLHQFNFGYCTQKVYRQKSSDSSRRCSPLQWVSNILIRSFSMFPRVVICICFSMLRNDLTKIYSNLNRLNEDMASSFKIRQQNFVEMQKNLDAVNSVLKSSIRLRGTQIYFIPLPCCWLRIAFIRRNERIFILNCKKHSFHANRNQMPGCIMCSMNVLVQLSDIDVFSYFLFVFFSLAFQLENMPQKWCHFLN